MTNHRNRFPARRRFLKQSAALSAKAASLTVPAVVLAQSDTAQDTAAEKSQPTMRKRSRQGYKG